MPAKGVFSWAVFILLSIVWGSSFILIKKSAEHLNGWEVGAARMFFAALTFLPFAIVHLFQIPRNKLLLVILTGFLGNLLPAFLFALAIDKQINSSLAAIMNSLTPLCVILLGALFFHVRVKKKQVAGVLIGFAGLLILTLSRDTVTLENMGYTSLILLATLLYGINVNIVSVWLKGVDPIKMATVSIAFLVVPSAAVLWQQQVIDRIHDPGTRDSLMMAALLGVVGSAIATLLFYMLIKKAGGLFASLVTYAIPVVAILWGVWTHEAISVIQVGCLGVILSGVYLANR